MGDAWRWRLFQTWSRQYGLMLVSGRGGSSTAIGAGIAVILASSVTYWRVGSTLRQTLSLLALLDVGGLILLLPSAHTARPPAPSPTCFPSTAPMPYLPPYLSNVLRPSPALLSLSLPCLSSSSSLLRNTHSCAMLADGTWFRILHSVHDRFCCHAHSMSKGAILQNPHTLHVSKAEAQRAVIRHLRVHT